MPLPVVGVHTPEVAHPTAAVLVRVGVEHLAPAPTLRRRLIASLSAFALVLIALFSGFALLMAYIAWQG